MAESGLGFVGSGRWPPLLDLLRAASSGELSPRGGSNLRLIGSLCVGASFNFVAA